jgi:hypothetical protein
MTIPTARLGWMAGVIDLKGKIVFKNNKLRNTRQITLYVQSKEIGIIRSLGELTGTRPELKAAEEVPAIFNLRHNCREHCPEAHTHVNAPGEGMMPQQGRWTISGAAMVVVLYNLRPFLVMDRGWDETMDLVIDQTVRSGRGFQAVKVALVRLQDLGWKIPPMFATALIEEEEEDGED